MTSIAESLSPGLGNELDTTGYKALVEVVWHTAASMQPWDPIRESFPGLRVIKIINSRFPNRSINAPNIQK
jgi:hypothetical protein